MLNKNPNLTAGRLPSFGIKDYLFSTHVVIEPVTVVLSRREQCWPGHIEAFEHLAKHSLLLVLALSFLLLILAFHRKAMLLSQSSADNEIAAPQQVLGFALILQEVGIALGSVCSLLPFPYLACI